jgi:hypothetical protein
MALRILEVLKPLHPDLPIPRQGEEVIEGVINIIKSLKSKKFSWILRNFYQIIKN